MPAILGTNGLTIQTTPEIAAEFADRARELTGNASLSFEGDTILGQLNTADSDRIESLQQLLQGLDDSQNLMAATGVQLTQYCLKGSVIRKAATRSLVTDVKLGGTTGATVPVGTLLGIPNIANRFSTQSTVTLAAATAWATSTAYTVGTVRKANSQVWLCAVAGTSAGAGAGPTGTTTFTDNTVTWYWIGAGDGFATTDARAVDTGPIGCAANGLTVIVTPVAGFTGCANLTAAAQGAVAETDPALRIRYLESYSRAGSATVNAILADLLALEDVSEARVYQNNTSVVGGGAPPIPGMPRHSVWAIVDGTATAATIGESLIDTVAAGIQIGWSAAPSAVDAATADSQGIVQPIWYSTPVDLPVDVNVSIVYGTGTGPATVASDITDAINALTIGDDVRNWRIANIAGDAMVADQIDPELISSIVVTMRTGADPYTTNNVDVDYNEKASAGTVVVNFS
jgi:uncharacterized phage protein gp47/JayE